VTIALKMGVCTSVKYSFSPSEMSSRKNPIEPSGETFSCDERKHRSVRPKNEDTFDLQTDACGANLVENEREDP
jgi:hypothetical protein